MVDACCLHSASASASVESSSLLQPTAQLQPNTRIVDETRLFIAVLTCKKPVPGSSTWCRRCALARLSCRKLGPRMRPLDTAHPRAGQGTCRRTRFASPRRCGTSRLGRGTHTRVPRRSSNPRPATLPPLIAARGFSASFRFDHSRAHGHAGKLSIKPMLGVHVFMGTPSEYDEIKLLSSADMCPAPANASGGRAASAADDLAVAKQLYERCAARCNQARAQEPLTASVCCWFQNAMRSAAEPFIEISGRSRVSQTMVSSGVSSQETRSEMAKSSPAPKRSVGPLLGR